MWGGGHKRKVRGHIKKISAGASRRHYAPHLQIASDATVQVRGRPMGGATVLKVGGQFCKRSKKNFGPPLFGQWGTKYCLDS